MTLKESLDELKIAFANFEVAARSDDKTPLQNALSLNEAKDNFAIVDESPRIIVFGDINRFKSVNTAHGYAAGDAAISHVGRLIHEKVVARELGQAYRPSGDEFIILLQSKYLDDFLSLTHLFSNCEVRFDTKVFYVGVSFGYAVSNEGIEFEIIKSKAELACKKAKTKGDGTCLEWTAELEQTSLKSLRHTCEKCESIIACEVPETLESNKLKNCPVCGNQL